jgi:hypothetical protein
MILDILLAEYLHAVAKAAKYGKILLGQTIDGCQECGQQIVDMTPGEKALHVLSELPGGDEFVVLGCEGYRYVDPELLGLPRGNWQDWQVND